MVKILPEDMDVLFYQAHTFVQWQKKPVSAEILKGVYDAAKMAPTAANCQPMRVVFVVSDEAKEKLKPCLARGNVNKTMAAPATAIIAGDTRFYEKLPELFPFGDAKSWYEGNQPLIEDTLLRNTALQGAYLIMAARAFGLDCGPMSGFDNQKLDAAFFPDGWFKSNFLCNLGYADKTHMPPRAPRPSFEDACQIA